MAEIVEPKKCSGCKKSLPLTDFSRCARTKSGLQNYCKSCAKVAEKKFKRTRTDYRREQLREKYSTPEGYRKQLNRYFKWTYKITLEEYEQLTKTQNNLCAICQSPPDEGKRLYVDHCHNTKKIRGLLCFRCNAALGHFKDNPEILINAINYLMEQNK